MAIFLVAECVLLVFICFEVFGLLDRCREFRSTVVHGIGIGLETLLAEFAFS